MENKIIDEEMIKEFDEKLLLANAYEERIELLKEYLPKIYKDV